MPSGVTTIEIFEKLQKILQISVYNFEISMRLFTVQLKLSGSALADSALADSALTC